MTDASIRIVHIEDDPDMIRLIKLMLDAGRYEIRSAVEGEQGLRMVQEDPPDLILLDLMLPDMGGWAIYRALKGDIRLKDIPVIVVTAKSAPIDRVLGEHIAKVQVYITKPFSPKELREAVNEALNPPEV